jgi:hypothetical protein
LWDIIEQAKHTTAHTAPEIHHGGAGRRIRKSTGLDSLEEANAALARMESAEDGTGEAPAEAA